MLEKLQEMEQYVIHENINIVEMEHNSISSSLLLSKLKTDLKVNPYSKYYHDLYEEITALHN